MYSFKIVEYLDVEEFTEKSPMFEYCYGYDHEYGRYLYINPLRIEEWMEIIV